MGLNQVAIKIGNRGFNPMLMAAGRAALGGLCVFLWCYWKRIPLFGRDGTLKPGILAGLLFGVEFVLIFLAMELTSVGRVTLMMNVMPFWVAIGSHFLWANACPCALSLECVWHFSAFLLSSLITSVAPVPMQFMAICLR